MLVFKRVFHLGGDGEVYIILFQIRLRYTGVEFKML